MFNLFFVQKQVHSASLVRVESVAGCHSCWMISSAIRDTEKVWDGQEIEFLFLLILNIY